MFPEQGDFWPHPSPMAALAAIRHSNSGLPNLEVSGPNAINDIESNTRESMCVKSLLIGEKSEQFRREEASVSPIDACDTAAESVSGDPTTDDTPELPVSKSIGLCVAISLENVQGGQIEGENSNLSAGQTFLNCRKC